VPAYRWCCLWEGELNRLISLLAECQLLCTGKRSAMQPTVAVNSNRAALELFDTRLTWSLLEERQQALDAHVSLCQPALTDRTHHPHNITASSPSLTVTNNSYCWTVDIFLKTYTSFWWEKNNVQICIICRNELKYINHLSLCLVGRL